MLTCTHVLPAGDVRVTVVHLGATTTAAVELSVPVAEDGSGDLTVLRLAEPVPRAVVAPPRSPIALSDHDFVVHGFTRGFLAEARGRLGGRVGPGWVQMDDVRGFGHVVDRGFSGAPVWDDTIGAVVGIVVAAQKSAGAGYLIPVAEIVRMWPAAREFTGWRLDLDEASGTAALSIATLLHRLAAGPGRRVVVGTRVGARGSATNVPLNRLGNLSLSRGPCGSSRARTGVCCWSACRPACV